MANSDAASYTLRFNEISQALEYANGLTWLEVPSSSAAAAGSNTQIQFNDDGEFGASAALIYDADNTVLQLTGDGVSPNIILAADSGSTLYFSSTDGGDEFGQINIDDSTCNITSLGGAGRINLNGILQIHSNPPGAASLLTITTSTTTQRDAVTPVEGMILYNVTTHKLEFYNGSAWRSLDDSAV